jgi:transcription elongation factor Elf1
VKGKAMEKQVCFNFNTDNYSSEYVCDDCGIAVKVTFEPYGNSKMAVIDCRICGVSYDTNLDPTEVK